jgi:hypothetical protein
MTHDEIVEVIQFLFEDKSLLFQDEKVLQIEAKFPPINSAMDTIAQITDILDNRDDLNAESKITLINIIVGHTKCLF